MKLTFRVDFVPVLLARDALLRYHALHLHSSTSNIYVEDALSDAIKRLVD